MKYILLLLCALCLILSPGMAFAKKGGNSQGKGKGLNPSESAYEHASDNAKFKRGEDWQGGQGKYDEEDEIGELIEKEKKTRHEKKEKVKNRNAEQLEVDEKIRKRVQTESPVGGSGE